MSANFVKMRSVISPAALQVNVAARVESRADSTVGASNTCCRKQLLNWYVFPDPAEARMIVFVIVKVSNTEAGLKFPLPQLARLGFPFLSLYTNFRHCQTMSAFHEKLLS
jgi:hypothetical protein